MKAKKMTTTERRGFLAGLRTAASASIRARMGRQYAGNRDLFEALGYNRNPSAKDYFAKYYRQDIARRVIDMPVKACWRRPPKITESAGDVVTPFEAAWQALVEQRRIYREFSRADRLASISKFGVLFMGFDDAVDFGSEVTVARELLYLMPYGETSARIDSYETDKKSERFGLPEVYKISISVGTRTETVGVHWSRLLHIAEDMLESNVEGRPKLEAILNRLDDLEKIVGGSGEMFWRGGMPGWAFIANEDATWEGQTESNADTEVDKWIHDFQRILKLEGVTPHRLAPQVESPKDHVDVNLDIICATTGIPKRIFMGSERGELASTQDEKTWADQVDARRRDHCEPVILRPFIDRLITVGILPEPADGYSVEWPDLLTPSDKDKADVALTVAKALKEYTGELGGADAVLPVSMFLELMGYEKDQIQEAREQVEDDEGETRVPEDDEDAEE